LEPFSGVCGEFLTFLDMREIACAFLVLVLICRALLRETELFLLVVGCRHGWARG
jgi:hypothetical protein